MHQFKGSNSGDIGLKKGQNSSNSRLRRPAGEGGGRDRLAGKGLVKKF